ncbi:hypothetical protein ACFVUN_34755 [Kitasatospora griseola]|uniref:hypothetical protein n=1 Tax=Kitasatospora griseola TaxID=2064 RepID=UPI0036D79541
MDVVYASLRRKEPGPAPAPEASEVVGILWAHARPADALQHITVRCELEQVDLLLYLLNRPTAAAAPAASDLPARAPSNTGPKDPLAVAHDLITRSHEASPMLRRRYQPPIPPTAR